MTREYADWREYQEEVAAYFRRQGCTIEVEARVQGARAEHRIDVYVLFARLGVECRWIIECKLWNARVPKEKVMALKSIVEDVGADKGFIFCENGFQSGALDAARGTNIALVTSLEDFERTAHTTTHETKLIEIPGTEEEDYLFYEFPSRDEPYTLLKHKNRVFIGNWQTGNIAVLDPATRSIEKFIMLDNYESISPVSREREIRRYQPGNMTVADGKLFMGQVFSDFILAIDVDTNAIVKRLAVPGGGEGKITSSHDGREVYFASNKARQFFIIDSATYEYKTIPYPEGGRGSMSIFAHPRGDKLYIGIQRGGTLNGMSYPGGNSFLAVFDLREKAYVANVYLAEIIDNRSDDSTPHCIVYDEEENQIFVGMFQSRMGIYRIDAESNEIIGNIAFRPNQYNEHFKWVDPLSLSIYGNFLLSVNRNNREFVVLRKEDGELLHSIFLGDAPNGPHDLVVVNNEAIISYRARNGLVFVALDSFA